MVLRERTCARTRGREEVVVGAGTERVGRPGDVARWGERVGGGTRARRQDQGGEDGERRGGRGEEGRTFRGGFESAPKSPSRPSAAPQLVWLPVLFIAIGERQL